MLLQKDLDDVMTSRLHFARPQDRDVHDLLRDACPWDLEALPLTRRSKCEMGAPSVNQLGSALGRRWKLPRRRTPQKSRVCFIHKIFNDMFRKKKHWKWNVTSRFLPRFTETTHKRSVRRQESAFITMPQTHTFAMTCHRNSQHHRTSVMATLSNLDRVRLCPNSGQDTHFSLRSVSTVWRAPSRVCDTAARTRSSSVLAQSPC